jgi:hypothetical protein
VSEIAVRRLHAQRLVGDPFSSAVDTVRWLGAVQSQDFSGAKWALAQRTAGATEAALDRLLDQGAILRTHLMRPTWHFVLPDDIRWLLDLTSPRLLAGLAGRYRQLELDQRTVARAADLFAESLSGGAAFTRAEMGNVLQAAGISPEGQRLPHLLGAAEAMSVIVSGPSRGKQSTYALLAERAPAARRLDREEALGELTKRYFRSHGPAQIQDCAWWSHLTVADVKKGLALAAVALERRAFGGTDYWFDSESQEDWEPSTAVHLLPNFDELTVAYRDRSALIPADVPFDPSFFAYYRESSPQGGILSNVLTVGGIVHGSWRRTLTSKTVRVEVRLLSPRDPSVKVEVERAAAKLGRFLQFEVELRLV